MINKNEKNSFFNYLDPFERSSAVSPYACAGIKGSCEKYCPSYVSLNEIKELGLGEWFFIPAQMDRISTAKPNFLPRSIDMYAGDFPQEIRETFLKEELSKYPNSLFFVASKNPYAMVEESFSSENIVWTDSVSSQEEIDFLACVLGVCQRETTIPLRKALLIAPLVEPLSIPKILIETVEYLVVDGYYGSNSTPLRLEWLIRLEQQAREGDVKFIFDGIGNSLLLYGEKEVKINQKKLYNVPIAEIVKKASPK